MFYAASYGYNKSATIQNGYTEIAKMLVDAGANVNHQNDVRAPPAARPPAPPPPG